MSTFVFEPGGSVTGEVDGGTSNTGTVVVDGHRNSVVSDPTDRHSGTLVVDSLPIIYAGMAPIINGSTGAYTVDNGSSDVTINNSGGTTLIESADSETLVLSNVTTSLTINGGHVTFAGDLNMSSTNASLIVNAKQITVNSGVTINTGTGDITFNAVNLDNGTSALGITSTLLGVDASIDLTDATLIGHTISLTANAGTLNTTVSGTQTLSSGSNLTVASTAGFASGGGTFTIGGSSGTTCTYASTTTTSFQNLSGCTGSATDKSVVDSPIDETGADHGINYSGAQLLYNATVDVHGSSSVTGSTITAGGDVTIQSTVHVVATASANGDLGTWSSTAHYNKGDIVIDPNDKKRYDAKNAVGPSSSAPDADSSNWELNSSNDSSVAATVLVATAQSQLSDVSTISATNGNVKIDSAMSANVTTLADSSTSQSGGGVAVGVVVTDSEAFINSTATEPVQAKGLNVSADTTDSSPTTGKASQGGSSGNDTSANSPASNPVGLDTSGTNGAADKANNKSSTSDGSQNLSAALAVTVLVATTHAYIAPNDTASPHTLDISTGTVLMHAGVSATTSAIADAGNVKFSPDAPTFSGAAATGGNLTGGSTYYYRVSATFAGGGESVPGPEASYVVPGGSSNTTSQVQVNWTAVANATGYKIYRGDASGNEALLGTVGATTHYVDNTSSTPSGAMPTADPASGIGVAVAVNVADLDTHAWLAGNLTIDATGGTTVETVAPGTGSSTFTAHATSGAGGTSVGIAGSIAVNIVTANTISEIQAPRGVGTNGNVSLTATSNLANAATADAKQSSDGNTTGIGASFALDVVNDTTSAGLPDNSVLTGAGSLTLTSNATDSTTTTADGGASAGSGSAAISAQVAITISNVTTSATVGSDSGTGLTLTGGLTAHATQTASTKTIASGSTKGGNAGIGLSLALLVSNHSVDSQLKRNLTAAGAVSFTADGSSSNDTEATASSAGSQGKKDGGDTSTDSSNKDVNKKADDNLASASSNDSSGKTTGTTTPSASSGQSGNGSSGGTKVTVAAAAAIAIVSATSQAQFADGLTLTDPTGAVSFNTSEDTDSTAKANGSATKGTSANIGAAVAINLVTITNTAIIGANDVISSNGLTVMAAMRTTGGSDGKNTLDTESTAGAGSGKLGIAGSLALTIATITTKAEIRSNATRGPPGDNLHGQTLTLSAAASVSVTTKAMAKDSNAGTVGIGAGAAIAIYTDTTTATIDDGATFSTTAGQTPGNVSLTASDTDSATTYAEAGASAGSGSTLSLTADAAVALPTVITGASINGGTSQNLTATGKVTLSATQSATTKTTAKGDAAGGTVAIGLALALAVPDDEVTATISRTIGGSTAVSLTATGSADIETEADASAAGAAGKGSGGTDSSGKDVNQKANDQITNANTASTSNGGSASSTSNTNNAQATTSDSNGTGKSSSGGGNTVTVAGAAAINVATTLSKAYFADSANVTSTGAVTLKAAANTVASAIGSGKSTDAGTVGIGAGVAVNSVGLTNVATTGNSTISSNGLDIEATMSINGADRIQRYDGTKWTTIDQGSAFPEQPSDGDFFQLTQGVASFTTIDGDNQTIDSTHTTLTVKSTAGWGPSGTFTISGYSTPCAYTGLTSTTFTGVTGCAVASSDTIDKLTVTETTTTSVNGASQTLDATHTSLNVGAVANFNSSGKFTVAGVTGTCSYTSVSGNTLQSISGCTGSPADGATITEIGYGPGVYKYDGSSSAWQVQNIGIPSSSTFSSSPSSGDYFQATKAPSSTTTTATGAIGTSLALTSTANFPTVGTFTGTGLTGTCAYTGNNTTTNTLSGITGCTGTVTMGTTLTGLAAGIYKWNGSAWVLQGDGNTFPTSPSSGDYYRLAEH
ncbi:MAG TPA: hypothetical protein VGN06_07620, partial [Gaiellaceae bacterium]